MGDRLKLQFLLFEAYHRPGKIFANKTIKKALLQMKKCLLDAEIYRPLFVRKNPLFRVFSIKIGWRNHCPAAHRP